MYFEYGEREYRYLSERDDKLAAVISRTGIIKREINPDVFAVLINSIVGQQISGRAQETIWGRLKDRLGAVTPEAVFSAEFDSIRSCGVSAKKTQAIKSAAEAFLSGDYDVTVLSEFSDDELVKRLVSLKGVGVWTAEMLMIFSLGRPNVLSAGDLGIRRGLKKLYGYEKLDGEIIESHKKIYSPYCTIASFYLWETA